MKKSLLNSSICLIAVLLSSSGKVSGQFHSQKLTQNLQHILEKEKIPGIAVVLVDSKKVIYKHAFGKADLAANKLYKLNTIQEVGSVSKMLLAVALMKAVELGYFSLDTEVNEILPFKVVNPYEPNHAITIRELATHTSGIVDNQEVYMNTYQFDLKRRSYNPAYIGPLKELGYKGTLGDTTLSQFYFNYLAQQGKYYSPENFTYDSLKRTSSYSNIASALIAYLIEIKSGISYAKFTTQQIFIPLKMTNSYWFTSKIKLNKLARLKGILWNLYNNGTIGHDGDDPGVSAFLLFNPQTGLGGLFLCNKYLDDKGSLVKILTEAISR